MLVIEDSGNSGHGLVDWCINGEMEVNGLAERLLLDVDIICFSEISGKKAKF